MYEKKTLEELVEKCDRIKRSLDPENYRNMCKALIAALFLTGGRITEVLMLKRDDFIFDDPEATENNSFLVKDMYVFKAPKDKKNKKTIPRPPRTFPIKRDEPLASHLEKWVKKENAGKYLFPTTRSEFMHPSTAFIIVREAGDLLDSPRHINCKWFRQQRIEYLAEVRGFSRYEIQQYLQLRQILKVKSGREDWRKLLHVNQKTSERKLVKTGLDPEELVKLVNKNPCTFFPENIWKKMTDIEKSDFSDASKCLLSGIATPTVMVTLRAAEAVIKNYYESATGKKARKMKLEEVIDNLVPIAAKSGEKKIGGYLHYIRDKRNEAQHPNKVFSFEEAVQTFFQVIGMVSAVYSLDF